MLPFLKMTPSKMASPSSQVINNQPLIDSILIQITRYFKVKNDHTRVYDSCREDR